MERVLRCALDIGEQMLLCGGEVHRVEDSMRRICNACGAKRIDLFIITSNIVATFMDADGMTQTQTRQVKGISPDMEKLHKLNALSRSICKIGEIPEDFDAQFDTIMQTKRYSAFVNCMANAAMAAAFTLFFGGSFTEAGFAFFAGAVIFFTAIFAEKMQLNNIFSKFLSSTMCTLCAFAVYHLNLVAGVDKIMIGCIMLMIPGTGLTNALRDLFVGDSIAGMLRSTDALLSTLAIAMGYFTVAFFAGGVF